jgi:SAM-dependent methyltransferase
MRGEQVRLLGRYQGRNGAIEIVECSADGTRIYFEEGIRQSQATPDGESVFSYVKLMDELLHSCANILVLGCGGGNLATRLARLGKKLTIVDNNPLSFVIAQRYFALPDGLPLMVSDFRNFILDDDRLYDGIAIDVGGPEFCFDAEFDLDTCDAIRARLAPGGRIVMNVLVANDIDQLPDRIAMRLAGGCPGSHCDHCMRARKAVDRGPGPRRGHAEQHRAVGDPARQVTTSRSRESIPPLTGQRDRRTSHACRCDPAPVPAAESRHGRSTSAKNIRRISSYGLLALQEIFRPAQNDAAVRTVCA